MLSQRPEAQKKAGDQDKGTSSSFASDQLKGRYHYFTPVHNEVIKSSATLGHLWCSIENCLRMKWLLIKSLFFQIKPSERKVIFKVFVRYGQRPTVTEHDVSRQIPHPSCLKSSQDSYSHCRNDAYDVLLLPDKVNKPGKYYIGILYENGEGELQSRRKKRSCSGGGRQKRSCVEVKEAPRPENITVKPVYDPKTDVNYSLSLLKENCLFWDSKEERWLSRGCKVGLSNIA